MSATCTSVRHSASASATVWPCASRRATRVRPTMSRASTMFSGGRPAARSAATSAAMPPWPKYTTGPNTGSVPIWMRAAASVAPVNAACCGVASAMP